MKLQNLNTWHIFEVSKEVSNSYLQHKHIVEFKEIEKKIEVKEEVTEKIVEKVESTKKVKKSTKTK